MDPIDGIAGEAYLVPLNYQLASDLDKPKPEALPAPTDKPAPDDEADDETDDGETADKKPAGDPVTNFAPIVDDLIERATNRIYNALADKYPKRGPYWAEESTAIFDKFSEWFYNQTKVLKESGYDAPGFFLTHIEHEKEPSREKFKAAITTYLTGAR
jgi:hypothetical protein